MPSEQSIKIGTISRVSKEFGDKKVLTDINFELYKGEVLSILGPNGAGKTTLINLLLGQLGLSSGNIQIFDHSPGNIQLKRQCGAMLQVSGLPDMVTIKEHITLFQSYYPAPMDYEKVIQLSALDDIQNEYSKNLSGGQKQRLLFALAICGNPKLLFLDEPSVGMDVTARKLLWRAITELKQQGTSIILTTHYLEEADQLSDRIIMLNKGEIIKTGTPLEIKSQNNIKNIRFISSTPLNSLTNLVGCINVEQTGNYFQLQSSNLIATLKELLFLTDDINDLTISGSALEDAFILLNKNQ